MHRPISVPSKIRTRDPESLHHESRPWSGKLQIQKKAVYVPHRSRRIMQLVLIEQSLCSHELWRWRGEKVINWPQRTIGSGHITRSTWNGARWDRHQAEGGLRVIRQQLYRLCRLYQSLSVGGAVSKSLSRHKGYRTFRTTKDVTYHKILYLPYFMSLSHPNGSNLHHTRPGILHWSYWGMYW